MNQSTGSFGRTLAVATIVATFVVGACGPAAAPATTTPASAPPGGSAAPSVAASPTVPAIAGGTATIRLLGDWNDFTYPMPVPNPHTTGFLYNVYETLVALDSSAQQLVPYLASEWEITPTSVTFTLKEDVTCADGTALTPAVVEASFQSLIDAKSRYLTVFGAGPFSVSSDEAASTFTFTSELPYGDMVYGFSDPNTGIVCPAGLANPAATAESTFGSGPYVVTEAVHEDHVTMTLRPEWAWGPNGTTAQTPGLPDTLVYRVVANNTTAANLLRSGELDIAQIDSPDVDPMLAEGSIASKRHRDQYSLRVLAFNQRPGRIGTDIVIRQALLTAIDPAAFDQASGGRGDLSSSVFHPDVRCYDGPGTAALKPVPSIEAARKVLTDAGWTFADGKLTKDGQPLTVDLLGPDYWGGGPPYIAETWQELGVDVAFAARGGTVAQFAEDLGSGNFDATALASGPGGTPAIPGPTGLRTSDRPTPDGLNYMGLDDPILRAAVTGGITTIGEESCGHWATFQQQLWKAWHYLPLHTDVKVTFSRTFDVSGGHLAAPYIPAHWIWRIAN